MAQRKMCICAKNKLNMCENYIYTVKKLIFGKHNNIIVMFNDWYKIEIPIQCFRIATWSQIAVCNPEYLRYGSEGFNDPEYFKKLEMGYRFILYKCKSDMESEEHRLWYEEHDDFNIIGITNFPMFCFCSNDENEINYCFDCHLSPYNYKEKPRYPLCICHPVFLHSLFLPETRMN